MVWTPETIKLLLELKNPILILVGGILLGLFGLIFWLAKSKDETTLQVVGKIDRAVETMQTLVTTVDTLIKVGRIK